MTKKFSKEKHALAFGIYMLNANITHFFKLIALSNTELDNKQLTQWYDSHNYPIGYIKRHSR